MSETLTNNTTDSRYELDLGDAVAVANYVKVGQTLRINHIGVPKTHENQGVATRLMKEMLADIRSNEMKIIPVCSFAQAYLRRHPEEADLLV